jgi:hypothetical protein
VVARGYAANVLDDQTRRYLDAIAASWCAIWILVGIAVFHEVRGLRSLSDSVAVAGNSLDDTARTLDSFSGVPFIGPKAAGVARDARRTAHSAQVSARKSRASIDNLALLLGFSVPAVAILPLLLAYALLRVRRR